MKNSVFNATRYQHAIDNWWLSLLMGVFILIVGLIVFFKPGDSYLTLSVLFGIMVIVSGVFQLYLGVKAQAQSGSGWFIAGGLIELLLGILLLCTPSILFTVLPFVLGFWLLFRGFTAIGLASDMTSNGIKGAGWTIAFAILLIISALFVLFNPLIGVGLVVVWVGVSLVLAGIDLIVHAMHLRQLGKKMH